MGKLQAGFHRRLAVRYRYQFLAAIASTQWSDRILVFSSRREPRTMTPLLSQVYAGGMAETLTCECCGFSQTFDTDDPEETALREWIIFSDDVVDYVGCPLCPALFRERHQPLHEAWKKAGRRPDAFGVDDCVPEGDRGAVRELMLDDWRRAFR